MAFLTTTLSAWLFDCHLKIEAIGLFGLITQPYVFKILWAPFIDRFNLPWLSRRRDWMLATQTLLIVLIILLSKTDPRHHLVFSALCALSIAFVAATQDIAINAYQTDILTSRERGIGGTYTLIGYRIGMMLSGALALIFADRLGWQLTFTWIAACLGLGIFATLLAPKLSTVEKNQPIQYRTLGQTIKRPFYDLFQRFKFKWLLLLLLLMMLYKFSDAFTVALNTPFLQTLGFSKTDIGTISKGCGLASVIIGGLVGGALMTRISLFKALWYFGWLQIISASGYFLLALTGKGLGLLTFAVIFENFCSGMGTSAFLALVMSVCNKQYSGTQFALLTAIAALGRTYIQPAAGFIVAHVGWAWFYILAMSAGIPSMLLILYLYRSSQFKQHFFQS